MAKSPGRKHVIAVCGGINWELISVTNRQPKCGETFNSKSLSSKPGGKGATTAIALHRLSHKKPSEAGERKPPPSMYGDDGLSEIEVRMIGSIGSDEYGHKMKDSLTANFINVDGVRMETGAKSAVDITTVKSKNGENRTLTQPAANYALKPAVFDDIGGFGSEIPDLVVTQIELHRETVEKLILKANEAGIDVLLNASPAHYLDRSTVFRGVTHLILNESEAAILTCRELKALRDKTFSDWNAITDEFLSLGVQHVVVTLGANRAFFSERQGSGEYVDVDSVGGRIFLAR